MGRELLKGADMDNGASEQPSKGPLSRRDFLKVTGAGLAGLVAAPFVSGCEVDVEVGPKDPSQKSVEVKLETRNTPEPVTMEVPWQQVAEEDTFDDLVRGLDVRAGIYPYIGKAMLLKKEDGSTYAFMGMEGVIGAQALDIFSIKSIGIGDHYHVSNVEQINSLIEGNNELNLRGVVKSYKDRAEDGNSFIHGIEVETVGEKSKKYWFEGNFGLGESFFPDKWNPVTSDR